MKQKLVTADEAESVNRQPQSPCSDCPFSRQSLPGWLGSMTVTDWIRAVHGESRIDCHTMHDGDDPPTHWQCAGAAIYRANVHKRCWESTNALALPADKTKVFASPMEFEAHHKPYEVSK